MDDLALVKACADAMELDVVEQLGEWHTPCTQFEDSLYDPLTDDAQAMAMGKTHPHEFEWAIIEWRRALDHGETVSLNRILCERIAKRGTHEL